MFVLAVEANKKKRIFFSLGDLISSWWNIWIAETKHPTFLSTWFQKQVFHLLRMNFSSTYFFLFLSNRYHKVSDYYLKNETKNSKKDTKDFESIENCLALRKYFQTLSYAKSVASIRKGINTMRWVKKPFSTSPLK